MKNALLAIITLSVLMLTTPASAYEVSVCPNGLLESGLNHNNATFKIIGCPLVQAAIFTGPVADASDVWNDIVGADNRLNFTVTGYNCAPTIPPGGGGNGIGVWEVWNAPDNYFAFSNSLGETWATYFDCEDGGIGLLGAQVYVRRNLDWDLENELYSPGSGEQPTYRTVLLHEFGHVLGAPDVTTTMTIMAPVTNSGTRAGIRNGTSLTPTRIAESIWADDAKFMYSKHPLPNPGHPDIAVSPWKSIACGAFGCVQRHHGSLAGAGITFCPGDTVSVTFTTVSLGKVPGQTLGNVNSRLVLSLDDVIRTSDITVWSGNMTQTSTWSYNQRSFTISSSVPPGSYRVGAIVDPSNALSEDDEYNNASLTGMRVYVGGPSEC